MKYEILNMFSGAVQFTAEIDCAEDAPVSVKIGLAVKRAFAAMANLYGAKLYGAKGIVSFGPVGVNRRVGYAVRHGKDAMVHLGCFWGFEDKAIAAIIKKYGAGSTYEALVRAACRVVLEESQ